MISDSLGTIMSACDVRGHGMCIEDAVPLPDVSQGGGPRLVGPDDVSRLVDTLGHMLGAHADTETHLGRRTCHGKWDHVC